MSDYEICICGRQAVDRHHIVFRSECKALEFCELDIIPLCYDCHYSIHHGKGEKLNKLLKLQFQNNLEIFFNKPLLTREEIKQVLEIKDKPLNKLLKTLNLKECKYTREDVIRQCMGGKLIVEGE